MAFVNVNVVPMDSERVLSDQTVLVRGDRIVEVGPAGKVKVPAGALRAYERDYPYAWLGILAEVPPST